MWPQINVILFSRGMGFIQKRGKNNLHNDINFKRKKNAISSHIYVNFLNLHVS